MSDNLKFSHMFHQKSNSNLLTVSYVSLKMVNGSKSHFAFCIFSHFKFLSLLKRVHLTTLQASVQCTSPILLKSGTLVQHHWSTRCNRYDIRQSNCQTVKSVQRFVPVAFLVSDLVLNCAYCVFQRSRIWLSNKCPPLCFTHGIQIE